jgi:hypothetical protein
MADVVRLDTHRRLGRARRAAAPETVAVFPGVSLADLRRVWTRCIDEIDGREAASTGRGDAV